MRQKNVSAIFSAGAVEAVGFLMIDPLHFKAGM
jgi:hypothetical protein